MIWQEYAKQLKEVLSLDGSPVGVALVIHLQATVKGVRYFLAMRSIRQPEKELPLMLVPKIVSVQEA